MFFHQGLINTIPILAKHDRAKTIELLEANKDEVAISSASSLFHAMLALHPEQIWDEYQQIPKTNRVNSRI